MIVDCGGGTVDLTTVKLLNENQLGEIAERAGDYCGSVFIDYEFIKHLTNELGENAITLLKENYYGQMQYIVQEFCQHVKFPFTGDDITFAYEIDLEKISSVLLQHISDEVRQKMDVNWLIKLDYEKIKSMFDSVIDRIIRMIHAQLENCSEECSVMFLVGGFSQSEYLQKRIRQTFEDHKVYVPDHPIAAVSRGAATYGLSYKNVDDDDMDGLLFVIDSRVLKYTYGIKIYSPWVEGDPIERRNEKFRFHIIGGRGETDRKAKRGTSVKTNEGFSVSTRPTIPTQTEGIYEIFYTRKFDPKYFDEDDEEICILGKLKISWPDVNLGRDRPTTFTLSFGKGEITATAVNDLNGQNYQTTFTINQED
jgi:hypothetical protein